MKKSATAILFTALAAAACADPDRLLRPKTGGPAFDIADGSQNGGDPHFHFLPPIAPEPVTAGAFDAALEPEVEICRATGCSTRVAHFTMTTGPGSETVRVVPDEDHYIVNWHSGAFSLEGGVYRIRVTLGGFELGHADVKVVNSGNELRDVDRSRFVPLLNGRTLPIKFRLEAGAGAPDETPPTLTAVAFDPPAVDVTLSSGSITTIFTASDVGSGISRIEITLRSPSSTDHVACSASHPDSGSASDGVWSCEVGFDPSSEWGFWGVGQVVLTDGAGNTTTLSRGDLRDAGLPNSVEVIAPQGPGDLTDPGLYEFSFAPAQLDVTGTEGTVTVRAGWTDGQSGVQSVFVAFQHPETGQFRSCSAGLPETGTRNDGTWVCTFTIPTFSAGGSWRVISVQATDVVGNHVEIGAAALEAAGFPTELSVVSDQDVTSPTLTSFSFNPVDLDVTDGDGEVTVQIGWADAQSGVQSVFVAFRHPETGQFRSCNAGQPQTGNRNAGVWSCSFTIPRFSAGGAWRAISVQSTDMVGNHIELGTTQLEAAGFSTGLNVLSDQDVTEPTLRSFSFQPTAVDVRSSDAPVTVKIGWSDSQSGIQSVFVAFQHPETGQFRSCNAGPPESGTRNDGTWSCTFSMPALSAAGTWFAISVQATDAVGNHIEVGRLQLEEDGFPTALEVISGQ